jgi:NADH-quinone oxidoreductase subunit N
MLLIFGFFAYLFLLYLILPLSSNVTPLLIRLSSLFLILELIRNFLICYYIQGAADILYFDGVHRLNINILISEIFLIVFTLMLFQIYTYYLKSSEVFLIIFINVIALINLISSYDWLLTIINYELINISLYLIVSLRSGSEKALSASLKYFLLSALTTTFILLFITMIYGITGTIHWDKLGLIWVFIDKERN